MSMVKVPVELLLTVKRPSGAVEVITHPSLKSISNAQFKQIQEGTKKAGRGNVISYEIKYKVKQVITTVAEMHNSSMVYDATVSDMSKMGE